MISDLNSRSLFRVFNGLKYFLIRPILRNQPIIKTHTFDAGIKGCFKVNDRLS